MKGAFLLRLGIGVLAFMAVLGALLEIARDDHRRPICAQRHGQL